MNLESKLTCKYTIPWYGNCKKLVAFEISPIMTKEFCIEHSKLKCSRCGEQATRGCSNFDSSFVCGRPICSTCNKCPDSSHRGNM